MIVKLIGGLGNQMFQYAFTKSLESKGFEVLLDASLYANNTMYKSDINGVGGVVSTHTSIRNLEIIDFNISLPIINDFNFNEYLLQYKKLNKQNIFYRIYKNFIPEKIQKKRKQIYFIEDIDFLQKFSNIKEFNPYSYFEGYFQNIIYFKNIEDIIKKDFTLKKPLSINNAKIKDNIINTKNSVFLHIRRGDYLAHNSIHINLGATYYNNALKIIKQKLSEPYIFIFSNDIKWCKDNFLHYINDDIKKNMKFDFIDENNEGNAIEEMELMRSCKHAIMANSTFSFWAAYLIDNVDKIVIMPSQILYNSNLFIIENIRLKDWIVIDHICGDVKYQ